MKNAGPQTRPEVLNISLLYVTHETSREQCDLGISIAVVTVSRICLNNVIRFSEILSYSWNLLNILFGLRYKYR